MDYENEDLYSLEKKKKKKRFLSECESRRDI